MGSFFAGIKAGTIGGLVYIGGLSLFNIGLLYALKGDVLTIISQNYQLVCTPTATVNSTSIDDCFSSVIAVYIPFIAFLGFFVALFYAGVFGRFYEVFPGKKPWIKGEALAAIVGINLLVLDLTGIYFDLPARVALSVFFLVWTIVYGVLLGRLYKRYTRLVKFETQDKASLKILIDGRDFTGKSRTFAQSSTHRVRAEVTEDASFKEWTVSGGVTIEDPRSFETTMEISGDGLLKAQVGKKY